MMRPSAPAATAARAIGATMSRLPAPWLGSATIGRWLSFLMTWNRRDVEGVSRRGLERADAALTEDHVGVAAAQVTYSADSSHSSIVAEMPRLISTRLARVSKLPQQREVPPCMLRAPSWKMSAVLVDDLDLADTSITSVISFEVLGVGRITQHAQSFFAKAPESCKASCGALTRRHERSSRRRAARRRPRRGPAGSVSAEHGPP